MYVHTRLIELTKDGRFREKVSAVLYSLEVRGELPKIFETSRTFEEQLAKVKAGTSKTLFSFHTKKGSDGKARAVDVASRLYGWNARKRFWLILGAACQSYGLGWGGLFGLSRKQRARLIEVINELRIQKWPSTSDLYAHCPLGWDPAHIQTKSNWG